MPKIEEKLDLNCDLVKDPRGQQKLNIPIYDVA